MKYGKTNNPQNNIENQDDKVNSIMVVDDSKFARNILCDILRNDGFQVVAEAKNGLEAVEMTKEKKPKYIFLDVEMPMLDGLGAIPKILEIDPAAHIIMCTAMGQKNIIVEAVKAGAKDYVIKPYKKENILRVLNIIIESKKKAEKPLTEGKKNRKPWEDEVVKEAVPEIDQEPIDPQEYTEIVVPDNKQELTETLDIKEEEALAAAEETGNTAELNEAAAPADLGEEENLTDEDADQYEKKAEETKNDSDGSETSEAFTTGEDYEIPAAELEDLIQDEKEISDAARPDPMEEIKEAVIPEIETVKADESEEDLPEIESVTDNACSIEDESKQSGSYEEETAASVSEAQEMIEAAILLEVLKAEEDRELKNDEDNELKSLIEEMDENEYCSKADQEAAKHVRKHLIEAETINLDDPVEDALDQIFFSYLWRDRFDFNKEENAAGYVTGQRLSFLDAVYLPECRNSLDEIDNFLNGLLSGLATAFLNMEHRLQPEENSLEKPRNDKQEEIRIPAGTILKGRKDNDITITDLITLSANKKVNLVHIQIDTLSKAVTQLIKEKPERLL